MTVVSRMIRLCGLTDFGAAAKWCRGSRENSQFKWSVVWSSWVVVSTRRKVLWMRNREREAENGETCAQRGGSWPDHVDGNKEPWFYSNCNTKPCKSFLQGSRKAWSNLYLFEITYIALWGFAGGASGKEPACQCRNHKRCGFNPWVGKIPWRRTWQPTPVFLSGEPHGQRSLAGYGPQLQTNHTWLKRLNTHTHTHIHYFVNCWWAGVKSVRPAWWLFLSFQDTGDLDTPSTTASPRSCDL